MTTTIKALVQQEDPNPDDVAMYCFSNGREFFNDNIPRDDTPSQYAILDGLGIGITDGYGEYIEYGDSVGEATDVKIFELTVNSAEYFYASIKTPADESVTVHFGDGTSETYSGTTTQWVLHDYDSVGSREVTFTSTTGGSALTEFTLQGYTDVSFDIGRLPIGLIELQAGGYNTAYGNIADLPASIERVILSGNNVVTGDIAQIPTSITQFSVTGENTIYGDIGSLHSGVEFIVIGGSTTVSGEIGSTPASIVGLQLLGFHSVTYSTTWASRASMYYVILTPGAPGGMTASEVDQLLIDLDAQVAGWTANMEVTLTGANAERTSDSDSAVTSLEGKGVTVTTN